MKPDIDLRMVKLLLQWCDDAQSGEIIQGRGYCYDFFAPYDRISERTLNRVVKYVNPILKMTGCKIRITWSAGEIRPIREGYRIKQIDAEQELESTGPRLGWSD